MSAEATLAVSASPAGSSEILAVHVRKGGLRHSLVHGEPEIISAVVEWLARDPQQLGDLVNNALTRRRLFTAAAYNLLRLRRLQEVTA